MKLHLLGRGALAIAACVTLAAACSDDASDAADTVGAAGSGGTTAGTAGSAGSGGRAGGGAAGTSAGSGGAGGASAGGSAGSSGSGGSATAGSGGAAGAAGAAGAGGSGDDDTVTYTDDIQPILVENCSPCHAGDGNGGHDAATSYEDAAREAAEMLEEIESGSMPESGSGNAGCDGGEPGDPGCVSAEDFALIEQWVDDGTPE
jgi:hypothetical protein